MGDINWLYLARTPYWEEKDPGKRYAVLRKIKNKMDDYKGNYTLEAIAARLPEYPVKRLREIEIGLVVRSGTNETPMGVLSPLFTDLGMTEAEFLTTVKLKKGTAPVTPQPVVTVENAKPVEVKPVVITTKQPAPKPAPQQAPKPAPQQAQQSQPAQQSRIPSSSQIRDMKIVSHLSSAVILVFDKDRIHIYDDSPEAGEILKKPSSKWIGPADQVGNRMIEREFDLKGIKGL